MPHCTQILHSQPNVRRRKNQGASVEAQKKTTFSVYLCESLSPTPHIGDWALMSQGGGKRWLCNWESSELPKTFHRRLPLLTKYRRDCHECKKKEDKTKFICKWIKDGILWEFENWVPLQWVYLSFCQFHCFFCRKFANCVLNLCHSDYIQ